VAKDASEEALERARLEVEHELGALEALALEMLNSASRGLTGGVS
jgi:hypothetical protein